MNQTFLPVTWVEYQAYAQKLAAAILSSRTRQDEIIAISRGGLTLGHLLSDFLRIPIFTIAIQSYRDIMVQGELKITAPLPSPITGKRVLLVDDISDTGVTLSRALPYLEQFSPKEITTVTMFLKPQTSFIPDYFARKTKRWVIFPYEITETIQSITARYRKERSPKRQIQHTLESLGFTRQQIAFVWKHHTPTSA